MSWQRGRQDYLYSQGRLGDDKQEWNETQVKAINAGEKKNSGEESQDTKES